MYWCWNFNFSFTFIKFRIECFMCNFIILGYCYKFAYWIYYDFKCGFSWKKKLKLTIWWFMFCVGAGLVLANSQRAVPITIPTQNLVFINSKVSIKFIIHKPLFLALIHFKCFCLVKSSPISNPLCVSWHSLISIILLKIHEFSSFNLNFYNLLKASIASLSLLGLSSGISPKNHTKRVFI